MNLFVIMRNLNFLKLIQNVLQTIEARRDDLEEVQRQNDEDCARKEELLRDIEGINLARDQYEQQTTELQNLLHQQVAQHAEFDEACQALVLQFFNFK